MSTKQAQPFTALDPTTLDTVHGGFFGPLLGVIGRAIATGASSAARVGGKAAVEGLGQGLGQAAASAMTGGMHQAPAAPAPTPTAAPQPGS